jgi:hypothetical protein
MLVKTILKKILYGLDEVKVDAQNDDELLEN